MNWQTMAIRIKDSVNSQLFTVLHRRCKVSLLHLYHRRTFEFEILSMLLEDMQPIATVERSGYKKLFKCLLPHVDLPSRRTLGRNVDDMYESHKQQLIEELTHINYISTTVDLWSSHKRGFLGITAHYIDKSTLQRVSHVLTCQRFKHSHTKQDCS